MKISGVLRYTLLTAGLPVAWLHGIDFSGSNRFRGLDNQRPSDWNEPRRNNGDTGPTPQQLEQQRREKAATAKNEAGLDAFAKGDFQAAFDAFKAGLAQTPDDRVVRNNYAAAEAKLAVAAYKRGDAAGALAMFQDALPYANDEPPLKMASHLKELIGTVRRQINDGKRNDATAGKLEALAQNFSRTLPTDPGGFDGGGKDGGLKFMALEEAVPPGVVDARHVPSGLPGDVERAIARAYADAPAGVGDRVRKGFQAVMTGDWKVAKAWFGDALNHDPANVGLKRLVALADYAATRSAPAAPAGRPDARVIAPKSSDVEFLGITPAMPGNDATIKATQLRPDQIDNNPMLDEFLTDYLSQHPELQTAPATGGKKPTGMSRLVDLIGSGNGPHN